MVVRFLIASRVNATDIVIVSIGYNETVMEVRCPNLQVRDHHGIASRDLNIRHSPGLKLNLRAYRTLRLYGYLITMLLCSPAESSYYTLGKTLGVPARFLQQLSFLSRPRLGNDHNRSDIFR